MRWNILLFGLVLGLVLVPGAWAAQQATECELDEAACKFTITLNIAFDSGADASYRADAKNEIEDFWNNEGGDPPTVGECKCDVEFVVNTKPVADCDKEASTEWHCIKVTPFSTTPPKDTRGKKYMGYMYPPGISTGGNLTGWWSDQMSRPTEGGHYMDFAHEAGHMMGLEDGDAGIMSNTTPGQATCPQSLIDEIVADTCGKSCPDRCCCGNGEVEKGKGEACDPLAKPTGCKKDESCCPYCCSCYGKKCETKNGDYATEAECKENCKPEAEGESVQCVYSYWSGCWFCIPSGWESMYPETDPARIRECGECNHTKGIKPTEPEAVTTTQSAEAGEKAAETISNAISSSPIISSIFGDERANIYVEGMGEYYIIRQNGEIAEYGEGELPDQTMNIYTDELTVQLLEEGKLTGIGALKQDRITYEGVGFVEGIKFWIADFVVDWFVMYGESTWTEEPGMPEPEHPGDADVPI